MTRKLLEFHRDVSTRLRRFFDAPLDERATPLEIAHAVLDEIERAVQPVGRGRRIFPYQRLIVRVRPTQTDRAAVERGLANLGARLQERLSELGCEPSPVDVRVQVLKRVPAEWDDNRLFTIEYQAGLEDGRAAAAATHTRGTAAASIPPLQISVLKGAAPKKSYTFADLVVSIGRSTDPTDALGRMRHNRLAFADVEDGVTETVGRAHARLVFEHARGHYLLFDEGSSNGTSIARGGASIRVPPRDPRGVRILSGDEVHLGRAVIRVTVGGQSP